MTAGSSKALRTLEQALQLATRFASAHDDLNQWLDGVEAELNNVEPDATPAYQERQKVGPPPPPLQYQLLVIRTFPASSTKSSPPTVALPW